MNEAFITFYYSGESEGWGDEVRSVVVTGKEQKPEEVEEYQTLGEAGEGGVKGDRSGEEARGLGVGGCMRVRRWGSRRYLDFYPPARYRQSYPPSPP